jgi:hypothetical protein
MTVFCRSCDKSFEDYRELALHISSTKKGHRKGKRWAARYLMHVQALARKELNSSRSPLTEEEKKSKRSIKRELSGGQEYALTICPFCKKGHREVLPVEFAQSREAWRIKNVLAVMCQSCGG